jgi:hypothetical protein
MPANRDDLALQFAQEMRDALETEEGRHAVAEKIVKYVSDSVEQRDLAALLLPKEVIPVGTTAEYALPGKLKVYWHEPGSYAPRTQMAQKVFTVPSWMLSAHPEYELAQLEAGRYGTVQDQVKAAREAILGATNARVYNTLSGAIATTDKNYAASVANLTKAAIDRAINWVEDQTGGAAAIVGRRNLLYNMLDFNTNSSSTEVGIFDDATKNTIMKTGKVPVYRGVPVIGLNQWRDAFGQLTIPQDTVLVIGQDIGKYVVTQDLRSKDAIDVDTLVWHIHLYMKLGAAVFFPERMYKIKVTRS